MGTRREFLAQVAGAVVAAASPPAPQASKTALMHRRGAVQTVQGSIDASKLGFTLPHEHVCASSAGFWQVWPEFFGGRAAFTRKVTDKLEAARDAGVRTIVDVTPVDVGRDIRLLEEVSRKSGMQIVACTGHWLSPSLSMAARTADELAEFFILEIERGIEGTDIKPGVIKVATDQEGVTPFLEGALRAAARASKTTGVPVTTHTYAAGRIGEKQADIFESEGLNPVAVCLGHCDDSDDMGYLTGLLKRGYTIGMDHLTWGVGDQRY
jgi:phosphotriesterase-related protein